jgi:hypothetical protein
MHLRPYIDLLEDTDLRRGYVQVQREYCAGKFADAK